MTNATNGLDHTHTVTHFSTRWQIATAGILYICHRVQTSSSTAELECSNVEHNFIEAWEIAKETDFKKNGTIFTVGNKVGQTLKLSKIIACRTCFAFSVFQCVSCRAKHTTRMNMYLHNARVAPSEDNDHEFGSVKRQKKHSGELS